MTKVRIGVLTIGQSPREDIMADIIPLLLPHIEIVEGGLLDNVSSEEIGDLKPKAHEIPLITRLRDGSQVQLSEKKVIEFLPKAIDQMKTKAKVNAIGILCTHSFQYDNVFFPVIFPFDLLRFLVNRILKIRILGVVVPLKNQIAKTRQKWETEKIVIEAKSPYIKGESWEIITQSFIEEEVEAIILDCIGFRLMDKQKIHNLINVPILLPSIILASTINQLF
ncbi:MAG: AroM family protein [Promethearchaeota archaeon]